MKTRTITIMKKDIFFDVDAVTHVYARTTEGGGIRRADSLESDSAEPMAESLLTRFADHRAGELNERLGRFIKAASSPVTSASSVLGNAVSYTFDFQVEDAFQDELLQSLAAAMEKYISHGVTADWYSATGDPLGGVYAQMLPGDMSRIHEYLVKRKLPARS